MHCEDLVDTALVATTSAWAVWLNAHKEFEPDHTWMQVAAGVALCLGAAKAHARFARGSWEASEADIWRAFFLGAPPIIIGEIAQWIERQEARRNYKKRGLEE